MQAVRRECSARGRSLAPVCCLSLFLQKRANTRASARARTGGSAPAAVQMEVDSVSGSSLPDSAAPADVVSQNEPAVAHGNQGRQVGAGEEEAKDDEADSEPVGAPRRGSVGCCATFVPGLGVPSRATCCVWGAQPRAADYTRRVVEFCSTRGLGLRAGSCACGCGLRAGARARGGGPCAGSLERDGGPRAGSCERGFRLCIGSCHRVFGMCAGSWFMFS